MTAAKLSDLPYGTSPEERAAAMLRLRDAIGRLAAVAAGDHDDLVSVVRDVASVLLDVVQNYGAGVAILTDRVDALGALLADREEPASGPGEASRSSQERRNGLPGPDAPQSPGRPAGSLLRSGPASQQPTHRENNP